MPDALRRVAGVKTTLLPDGYIVLIKPSSTEGFTLSPMAALLWEFADGEHTLDEIEASIRELVPEVPQDGFTRELAELAQQLIDRGFLRRNE
jgi:hypothetical protein